MRKRRVEVEIVDNLYDAEEVFRSVEVAVTPDLLGYYRSIEPFGFMVDRQSLGRKVLGDPEEIGHIARVRGALEMATRAHITLPAPVPVLNRQSGDLPFTYDHRHHFLDGTEGRSSGRTFAPSVRKEFWRCYATARRLKELGAPPAAVFCDDPTRWTRADEWLKVWVRAFMAEGVAIYFGGYGKVEPAFLDLISFQIRVMSDVLHAYTRAAREIARREGKVYHPNAPVGLRFENGRREVWTDPEVWPLIWGVVHGLADGSLRNAEAASRWTREQAGEQGALGKQWVRELLKPAPEGFLDGEYVTNWRETAPCVIKERHGPTSEFTYTDTGHKRYVVKRLPEEKWVSFTMRYSPGTAAIPPDVLEAARRRLIQRGRPPLGAAPKVRSLCIIPPRKVRCSVCGTRIVEISRPPRGKRPGIRWQCRCEIVSDLANNRKISWAEARNLPEAQHRGCRGVSLSLALQSLLMARLFGEQFDPAEFAAEPTPDRGARKQEIEKRQEEARGRLRILTGNLTSLDLTMPDVAAEVNARLREAQQAVTDCDRELQVLAAESLHSERQGALFAHLREVWALAREEFGVPLDQGGPEVVAFWQDIVECFVDRVVVDLEEATFSVEVNLRHAALRDLEGRLTTRDKVHRPSCLWTLSSVVLTLCGSLR